jgi:hypothetical protein
MGTTVQFIEEKREDEGSAGEGERWPIFMAAIDGERE